MKDTEREIELIDYIEIVLKRKWLIAAATLAGLAGGWFLRADPPPTRYEATVLLLVKPLASAGEGGKDTKVALSALSTTFYSALALADDLKQALIDSLGLGGRISSLDGMLEVEHVDQTGLRLRVHAIEPGLAIEMVNAWAEIYLERNRGLSSEEVESFFQYVSHQYGRSRKLLESAEDSLQSYLAGNRVGALEQQQAILVRFRSALEDTLIVLQIAEQELKAELENAEEQLKSIEVNGRVLSLSNIEAMRDSSQWPRSAATRSMILNMHLPVENEVVRLKLDANQQDLHELDGRHELRLVEFNRTHDYEKLAQQLAEVESFVKIRRSEIVQSRSGHLLLQKDIESREQRLRQRSPILKLTDDRSTPNPAYVEIVQEIDSLRALRATYDDRNQELLLRDLERAEINLIRLQEIYLPLRREREAIVEQFTNERRNLVRQISSLRNAYEASTSNQLANRGRIASLRPQLQNLQAIIKGNQKALRQTEIRLRDVEEKLSLLVSRRDRMTRSQQTYQGTFDRFSTLFEQTRIAREKAAGDIQILTRAIEARIVPQESPKQKALISGAVALIVSTFLAFLLEYVRKARLARAVSSP